MLDFLRLQIPFADSYCTEWVKGKWRLNGDVTCYGLPAATRQITRHADGSFTHGDLYMPWESIPSSYESMAIKVFHSTINKRPYVELKASPAKMMQGHNVYGSDSIRLGGLEMLSTMIFTYPDLPAFLDMDATEVMHLDTTFSSRLPNQGLVPKVLDFLKQVENGHVKINYSKCRDNTVKWDGDFSRYYARKCYGKFTELTNSIADLHRRAKRGDSNAQRTLRIRKFDDLLDYSQGLLRWEASVKKRKLEQLGIPNNFFELVHYQDAHPDLLQTLWHQAFDPIFDTLRGLNMTHADDEAVLKMLRLKLQTTTKKGNISYTKAHNAYNFWLSVRHQGFSNLKTLMPDRTFRNNVNALVKAGISKSSLQNLHKKPEGKVIPFIQYVQIDFGKQHPDDWQEPSSNFADIFNHYGLVA